MPFYCSRCAQFDATNTALTHRCSATNGATNTIIATNNATNSAPKEAVEDGPRADEGAPVKERKTANRRSKEAYNAYQREYMRNRRKR